MLSHRLRLGLVAALVAGVVAVGACSPTATTTTRTTAPIPPGSTKVTKTIAAGTLVVAPGGSRDIGFYVDFGTYRPRVTGSFHASGGANDIEVFIVNDEDYNTWKTGRAIKPIYNSKTTTAGEIDVLLPTTGHLYLVFNNTYASTQKSVQADIYVEWWVAPPST